VSEHELSGVHVFARDGVPIVRLEGEIDLSNADSLFSTLARVGATGQGLIVDLSDVDYLDSAGVRLLFRLARALAEEDRVLRAVVPANATIRRVLELANMEEQIAVDESEEAALASVGAS